MPPGASTSWNPRENARDRVVQVNIQETKGYRRKLSVVQLLGVCLDYAGIAYAVRDKRFCVPVLTVGSIAEIPIRFAPLFPFKVRIFFGESVECIDGVKW